MLQQFSAILFDLDGTLVSTIDAYKHAVLKTFNEAGLAITPEEFDEWYTIPYHLEEMLKQFGKTEADVPGLRAARDTLYIELLKREARWIDGAQEALQRIAERYPVAIVTGSHRSYVDAIDECLHLYQYITPDGSRGPRLITADEMGKLMKPHPHGLLLAADLLAVEPGECLYIGDQRFDMLAAQAAGMVGWLLRTDFTPKQNLPPVARVLTRVGDLSTLLVPDA